MASAKTNREPSLEDLFTAMTLVDVDVGSKFYAIPTHLVDPHNFYVMPVSYVNQRSTINRTGKPVLLDELQQDMIIVYRSNHPDIKLYFGETAFDSTIRGRIERVGKNNTCLIYALDHGFTDAKVPLDSMWHPYHQEALTMPPLTYQCALDLCTPVGGRFGHEAIDAFKFYMGNEKLLIHIHEKSGDKFKVRVYNSNPNDVSTLLALTNYTFLTNLTQNSSMMTVNCPSSKPMLTYEHRSLVVGETLLVRVQYGISLESFYVCPMDAYSKYLSDRPEFTRYCRSLPEMNPEEFKDGTLVGVCSDMYYERAIILKGPETNSRVKVKLVDWGTELETSGLRIKEIKSALYTMRPVSAIYCTIIKDFQPWKTGLPTFLYIGNTFIMSVNEVGKGFEIPNTVTLSKEK